jgi:hypothetical protein
MEEMIKELAPPTITETVEPAPALPPVEPQGGGLPVGSIAAVIITAAVIYAIGRVCCKK